MDRHTVFTSEAFLMERNAVSKLIKITRNCKTGFMEKSQNSSHYKGKRIIGQTLLIVSGPSYFVLLCLENGEILSLSNKIKNGVEL